MGSTGGKGMSWSAALVRAAGMLIASAMLFLFIPNRLLAYLSLHVVPNWRDFLMLLYWAAAFVVGCWLFLTLQRERGR